MNDNNNMIPDLSSEDSSHLHELIQLSYPTPKNDIREQVMAEIARETKRRARISRMVRYGGMAACFVLIAVIVITIAPMLNRTAKDTVMDAEAEICNVNTVSSYSKSLQEVEALQSESITYTVDADIVQDDALSDNSILADCVAQSSLYTAAGSSENGDKAEYDGFTPESPTEAAVSEAEEKAASPNNDFALYLEEIPSAAPADACFICTMHGSTMHSSYHMFCEELISYVGKAEFDAWYGTAEALDECGIPSVRRMVEYFAIDRDTFSSIVEGSGVCYVLDKIFPQ